MPAISFQSVSKTFPAKSAGAQPLKALTDVSFDIAQGEFFGLLGPNGAGKTTLISILAGLSKATEGRVLVHGHDVQKDYVQARQLLGVVPQELVFDPFFSDQRPATRPNAPSKPAHKMANTRIHNGA